MTVQCSITGITLFRTGITEKRFTNLILTVLKCLIPPQFQLIPVVPILHPWLRQLNVVDSICRIKVHVGLVSFGLGKIGGYCLFLI